MSMLKEIKLKDLIVQRLKIYEEQYKQGEKSSKNMMA